MDDPAGSTKAEYCAATDSPTLVTEAHGAPIGMAFYTGTQFPSQYLNDAFVAMRGSWNRLPPSGYQIVRIRFDAAGKPVNFEPFVSGFLINNNSQAFARLAGITVHPDGSLLFSDDTNGVVYRVAYQ
jgi:glucose/arabinose dehydrogenase